MTRRPGRVDVVLPVLTTLARLALAGTLLASGTIKLLDPDGAVRAVRAYRVLPGVLADVVGYGLPVLEVGVALLLLVGFSVRFAAAAAGVLMAVFVVGIASVWARGLSIDCGCFGGGGDVAPGTASYVGPLLRDTGLLAAAVLLAVHPRTPWTLDARLENR